MTLLILVNVCWVINHLLLKVHIANVSKKIPSQKVESKSKIYRMDNDRINELRDVHRITTIEALKGKDITAMLVCERDRIIYKVLKGISLFLLIILTLIVSSNALTKFT